MSSRTISLDIRTDLERELNISSVFSLSEVHAIDNHRFKKFVDPIVLYRPKINLALRTSVEVSRFLTVGMLDLALPEVLSEFSVSRRGTKQEIRSRVIDIVPPLEHIPYGALDVRKEQSIPRKRVYPDLFRRSLPRSLSFRRKRRQVMDFLTRKKRPILTGMITILLIFLPAIWYIRLSVEHAYNRLVSIRDARNIHEIHSIIQDAKRDFERAEFLFLPFSWIPHSQIDLADRAIRGGRELTQGLDTLIATLPVKTGTWEPTITEGMEASWYRSGSRDIFLTDGLGITAPTDWLIANRTTIFAGIDAIVAAGKVYQWVKWWGKMAERMKKVGTVIGFMGDILQWYQKHAPMIDAMLGHKDPQRYIIFNQNRDEIRANGGFPGSIITFTLYKGNILDYRSDDVYYYDWNLYPHKETPPPGIALLTDNYGLRDVNYYPDFRMTLEKANRFVERSGDPTLSTAIAIHQGIVEDILKLTWPISLSWVSIPFDSENFSLLMSVLVEHEFARDKTPKDILFVFMNAFGKVILSSDRLADIADTIKGYLHRGEILFASRNDTIHEFLSQIMPPLPWKCETTSSSMCPRNWIYPVFTSVSGNKSDRYISRTFDVQSKRLDQCMYENTVTLTLEHQYQEKDKSDLEILMTTFGITDKEKMRFIQGNGKNTSFIRYYVPLGAELMGSGAGVEIEQDVQVFSFMLDTDVGTRSTKTLQYRLPIPACHTYTGSVDIVRQPGLRDFIIP